MSEQLLSGRVWLSTNFTVHQFPSARVAGWVPNPASAAFAPHPSSLRASTIVNIAAWIAAAAALIWLEFGLDPPFRGRGPRELAGILETFSDDTLGLAVLAGIVPMLASWRFGRAASTKAEHVRRRRALALVGVIGVSLMIALVYIDMAIVRGAITLGVDRSGWDFGRIWPSSCAHAAIVGAGRLGFVLRIEAAMLKMIETPAQDHRSSLSRLARFGLVCVLAAGAAAPLAWLSISDYAASHFRLDWELPALYYPLAVGVFEVCARLGLLGRPGPQNAAPVADLSPQPNTQTSHRRVAPDPAALALGHRALGCARRWFLIATIIGPIALAVFICGFGEQLVDTAQSRGWFVEPQVMLPIAILAIMFVMFQPALEHQHPAPPRPRLASVGLERVVQLLGQAIAQLEQGNEQQFEELYYDFTARVEALAPDELEALAARGIHPIRLRSLPVTWVDGGRFFDAPLRRGVHRELMQIQATIIGQRSADPYRANLAECGLIDSIGLGWLRGGKGRDRELGQTHRFRNVTVITALLVWAGSVYCVGLLTANVDTTFCVPGVDHCRVAFEAFDETLIGLTALLVAPFVAWVIGAAHRRVATRCFKLALPG